MTIDQFKARLNSGSFNNPWFCIGSEWPKWILRCEGPVLHEAGNKYHIELAERGHLSPFSSFDAVDAACASFLLFLEQSGYKNKIDEIAPITNSQLSEFLEILSSDLTKSCDHTFKRTIETLRKLDLPIHDTIKWLVPYNGNCDCTIVSNVVPEWSKFIDALQGPSTSA